MHILVITDEIYPDAIGGVAKSLYNECVALVRHGVQITVLVRSLNPSLPSEAEMDGMRVIRFQGPSRSNPAYYLYPLAVLQKVTQYLRHDKTRYDLFYVHSALYVIPILLLRLKTPVVSTFYSAVDEYIRSNIARGKYGRLTPFARIGAWLMGRIEGWAFARVNLVLPRSAVILEELRRCYPQAKALETIIPLGIDIAHYTPHPRAEARQHLNLPPDRPILITVRRLEGRMGLTTLVESMRTVSQYDSSVLLLIAGKGYLRETLEKLIREYRLENNVRLLGFVNEDELPLYLSAADLFVLPTESLEGFGLATIEALATSIPVVGTPVGATPEILTPIDPAFVTRDTSAAAIAETLIYWLERRQNLPALGDRSRAYAEAHYDAYHVAEQLRDTFTSVIEAR
jgi:glycosyltransferase involved in cell wall biosynthesis